LRYAAKDDKMNIKIMEGNKMKWRKEKKTDKEKSGIWKRFIRLQTKEGKPEISLKKASSNALHKRNSGSSILQTVAIFATLMLMMTTIAFAAQAPLPSLSASKSGSPSWVETSSDLVGDRGGNIKPQLVDIDADGDYDLFIGLENGLIEFWENQGNSTTENFVFIDNTLITDIGDRSQPTFYDTDKDGDFDMYVGFHDGYMHYYRNDGTPQVKNFVYVRRIINLGTRAAPFAYDENGDGQVDIYYGNSGSSVNRLSNDVLATGIEFKDFEIARLSNFPTSELVDIDNDGDQDAFLGRGTGHVYFVENIGNVSDAIWGDLEVLFDTGSFSDVAFADLDNDDDQDMVVGDNDGTLKYYRNDGSKTTPFWTNVGGFFSLDAGDRSAPTFADIDGDGDLDLFIGNTAGASNFYENQGTPLIPNFVLGASPIPDVGSNSHPDFVDLDSDNDFDLAIGRSDGYVRYFRNDGNSSNSNYVDNGNLLVNGYDFTTPTFGDLDNDGDLDLVTGVGDTNFAWVSIYKNDGTPFSPSFSFNPRYSFQNLHRSWNCEYIDQEGDGDMDAYCGREDGFLFFLPNVGTPEEPAWGASVTLFDVGGDGNPAPGDLDGDGNVDIIVGRNNDNLLQFYEYDSDNTAFDLVQINDIISDLGQYSNPWFDDLDNDGLDDLLVGYEDGFVRFFRNTGNSTNFIFSFVESLFDAGSYSAPTLGDVDNDGDLDLVVGTLTDTISYYRNDGNSTNHNFTFVTNDYVGGFCRNGDSFSEFCDPSLVDYDADGDLDIITSMATGTVHLWRNDGTPSIATWASQGDIIGDILGNYVKHSIDDLDNDGDLDILMIEQSGSNILMKNEGTAQSASFTRLYSYDTLGSNRYIDDLGSWMGVAFHDLDSDGDLDIISGELSGRLFLFRNDGIISDPLAAMSRSTHILRSTNVLGAQCNPLQSTGYCTPDLVDIDQDGDLDLIVGNYYREPRFWRNDGDANSYSFTSVQSIGTDFDDKLQSTTGDIDGDGDIDVLICSINGRCKLVKNTGTISNPSWTDVYRGNDGTNYIEDFGSYQTVSIVDINNDGVQDVWTSADISGTGTGTSRFLKNDGILDSQVKKANDPTWSFGPPVISGLSNYNSPTGADLDGDGDTDLLVGDTLNRLRYYTNDGDNTFTFSSQIYDIANSYSTPSVADLDGNGAIDFLAGQHTGIIRKWENTGIYQIATTVTIINASGPVVGANVDFSDNSGTVCSSLTDLQGKISCPLNYSGNSAQLSITGASGGDVSLGIFSPNSAGKTFITLKNAADTLLIDLERFTFGTFDVNAVAASLPVEVADEGKIIFTGNTDDAGFIDGFFPKKYLINKQEPFTQNRIMYDISLLGSGVYGSTLDITDVYVPNELQFGAAQEQNKLYKFLATHEMSSDAEYKGYVIYPALTAQRDYDLQDSLPSEFTYTGDVVANYLGSIACTIGSPLNSSSLTLLHNESGCGSLADPVPSDADWLLYQFTVRTPDLDYFITGGFNSSNFVIPPAQLDLIS
jgi:hypothetical protein